MKTVRLPTQHDASPGECAAETAPTAEAELKTPQRPWRRALAAALWVWLASRVASVAASSLAFMGDQKPALTLGNIAHKWATQWDSTWFIAIARIGYVPSPHVETAAYFPLYPLLIYGATPLSGGRGWLAALVIANLALFAALALLYRLADHEFGQPSAGRTIFYLVAFPTGFFLGAAYNMGLFIALVVGSVYAMRRGNWWVAGLLGAFAGATRPAGILLLLPFCYEYLRLDGRRLRLDVLAIGLIPLGLAGFMLHTWIVLKDPLAFLHAQSRYWGRQ